MTRSWGVLGTEKRGDRQSVSKLGFMCFAQSNQLGYVGMMARRNRESHSNVGLPLHVRQRKPHIYSGKAPQLARPLTLCKDNENLGVHRSASSLAVSL
jgi:hypothetical protein